MKHKTLLVSIYILFIAGCKRDMNKLPIANAGPDQLIALPVNGTTLDGGSSVDPDGTISSFTWKKASGPASCIIMEATSDFPKIEQLVQGTYEFELDVTDNEGAHSKDLVKVTVGPLDPSNHPPVAKAGADQILNHAISTSLDGSASFDPDSNKISYSWKKISGLPGSVIVTPTWQQTLVSNLPWGLNEFELTVSDVAGLTAKDTVRILMNRSPIANAGPGQTIHLPANSLILNGNNSSDPDNNIVSYTWTKFFGPASFLISNDTSSQAQLTNLVEGDYIFQLKVKDAGNLISTSNVYVRVDTLMPGNMILFDSLTWKNGCVLHVSNFYSFIPAGHPIKVYVRQVNADGMELQWYYARPFNQASTQEMFTYKIVNGELQVESGGIDCNFDDAMNTYNIGIVML